jgi:GGDEF domain-containing protein
VWTFSDISERKRFEEQLEHRAFHDPLTDLPNRTLFINRVQHALERLDRRGKAIAVLFVDLDRFKSSTTRWATKKATGYCRKSRAA